MSHLLQATTVHNENKKDTKTESLTRTTTTSAAAAAAEWRPQHITRAANSDQWHHIIIIYVPLSSCQPVW